MQNTPLRSPQLRRKNYQLMLILLVFIALLFGLSFVKFGKVAAPVDAPTTQEQPHGEQGQ